ncbi:AEC family transporter [Amedibacillus dolichus]|uniref:AEC family transporter n=1 Tax=Amedibacillus dolichus TaxID=31971 RepID=A0ABT7UF03_9FIRM|nr:AEC family transporter [Amedibacillus dolichus]MDM8157543.1 AEC family transporter [Amedibacillus dolichus]
MIDIWVLLGVMLELSALILLGLVLTKLHLLDEKGSAVLSTLVVHVFNPALIISSVCEGGLQTQGDTVIEAIICGVFLYALLILIAIVVYMRSKALKEEVSICKMIVIFSNTAFVGYPILRALYGDFAVFVFSLMHLPFNILIFTYGRSLLQKGNHQKMTVKDIFSIGTVSSIVALILYFGNISVPVRVADFFGILGDACVPLSMIVIGVSLAHASWKNVLKSKNINMVVFLRLIVLPVLIAWITLPLPISTFNRELLVISGALPAGSMIVVLAKEYKANDGLASAGVFLTTLLSVVTIPLMLGILL